MGRKMFSGGSGPWEDDPNADGWWGDEPPFGVPVFVLTHHAREREAMQGGTDFTSSPTASRRRSSRRAPSAGDKDVLIAGGGEVAQQYLRAGLLDEIQVHVAPVFLGAGVRLFDGIPLDTVDAGSGAGGRLAERHPSPLPCRPRLGGLGLELQRELGLGLGDRRRRARAEQARRHRDDAEHAHDQRDDERRLEPVEQRLRRAVRAGVGVDDGGDDGQRERAAELEGRVEQAAGEALLARARCRSWQRC